MSAGKGYTGYSSKAFKFRRNIIFNIVIHIILSRILYRKAEGGLLVNIHGKDIRILGTLRKIHLYPVYFLFQLIISLVYISTILILDYGETIVFRGSGLNSFYI